MGEGSRVARIRKLQEAGVTHWPARLGGWVEAPHAPLWALPCAQKCCVMLCHVASGH